MALQNIPGVIFWPDETNRTTGNPAFVNNLTIDAASEKAAMIFQAPKTGNVSAIMWKTGTVTTGATLDVRLETVDTTTGHPTGTLKGTNSNGSQVVANTDDDKVFVTTLTTACAVTKGDIIAVVIVNPGASFGNMVVSSINNMGGYYPYTDLYTTSWSLQAPSPVAALKYDDNTYSQVPGCYPFETFTSVNFNNGSSPDEIGNIFQVPFKCRVTGWWLYTQPIGATRDFDIVLYDSNGTTALQTYSFDPNVDSGTGAQSFRCGLFSGTSTLTINTNYRIAMKPTTANSNNLWYYSVLSSDILGAFSGGSNMHRTGRTDAGSWTQVTDERCLIGVLIDQLDDGVGSGGGSGGSYVFIG